MTLETALAFPALLLVLGLIVLAGRVQVTAGAVEHAAAAAAREASLARTVDGARTAATTMTADLLSQQGITCTPIRVTLGTRGFAAPVGQPAQVDVTVTCTVPLADLAIPGLPGTRTVTAQATSVLDRYRTR